MFIPIKYNLRYLATRWSSTFLTAFTFALVVATFVIVMSLARGIERALSTSGDPLNVIVLRAGAQAEGQSAVTLTQFPVLRDLPGVAQDASGAPMAAPEVVILANKPRAADGKPGNLQVRGVAAAGVAMRPTVRIVEGRMFEPGKREVVVARSVSRRFAGMSLGDQPRLGRGRWTVVGVFEAGGTAFDSELWADYRELMQEFDHNAYSTVLLRAVDAATVEHIARRVDDDRRLKLTAKSEAAYYHEQTRTAGPLKAFGAFLATIMSIGACFAATNTMYASVAGRTREIGTLRVLGFSPLAILVSFQIESVALALIGGTIGCLLSLPISGLSTGTTNFETFSEIVFYFTITPDLMVKGLVFAVVMGAVGGFLPAWTASRQPILDSLRQA